MSALTQARNTAELHVGAPHYNFEREVASENTVYAGSIAAQNSVIKMSIERPSKTR